MSWLAMTSAIACGGRPTPAFSRANTPASGEASIVWWTIGEKARSAWIEPAGAGHRVRATRGEAIVATAKGLWAFRERFARRVTLCRSCSCLLGEPEKGEDCTPVKKSAMAGAFVRVSDGAVLRLEEMSDDHEESCSMTEYEPSVRLEASVGARAVVVHQTYMYGCGAHGMTIDGVRWFDLDRTTTFASPAPPEELNEHLIATARTQFAEEADGCIESSTAPIEFYATHFSYSAKGEPTLAYEFSSPATYACGTGPGHYAVSTRVESDELPSALSEYASAPGYVTSFVAKLPKGATLGGVSRVEDAYFGEYARPDSK
jgi:hypothetical protein